VDLQRPGSDSADICLEKDLISHTLNKGATLTDQFNRARAKITQVWWLSDFADEHLNSCLDYQLELSRFGSANLEI
jgi:hypothetical protein